MKQLLLLFICSISALSEIYAQTPTCDIKNHAGSSIKVHADSKIGIYGNLINDGNFTDADGFSEVGFYNADTGLKISGDTSPEFATLITNLPNDLSLEVKSIVNTGLLFLNGKIITPRNTPDISIDLLNTDVVLGEGDPSHVDGYTSYAGNNAYVFPVGDDMRLRTIAINANAAQNTSRAAYFYEDPENPTTFATSFDRSVKEESITIISNEEFWDLDGNQPTLVTITWDALSNISDYLLENNLSELRVTGWSKSQQRWINLGNTNLTGTLSSGQITSDLFIPNDYEVITFAGTLRGVNPEEERNNELIFYNAISDNEEDEINSFFRIGNINKYPNNNLTIFNRWGVEVYSKDGYNENPDEGFRGKSNGRVTIKEESRLPVGTYFYILNYEDSGVQKSKSGYLYINR